MADAFRFISQREDVVAVLILLLLGQRVLDLHRVDAGQANDLAEELRIRWVLVAEIEVGIALPYEGIEEPILLPLFKELCPLKGNHEPTQELANLSQGDRDDIE